MPSNTLWTADRATLNRAIAGALGLDFQTDAIPLDTLRALIMAYRDQPSILRRSLYDELLAALYEDGDVIDIMNAPHGAFTVVWDPYAENSYAVSRILSNFEAVTGGQFETGDGYTLSADTYRRPEVGDA